MASIGAKARRYAGPVAWQKADDLAVLVQGLINTVSKQMQPERGENVSFRPDASTPIRSRDAHPIELA